MELSILVARMAAVTYLTTGIALLTGSLDLKKTYDELKKSQMATTMMGAFTLLLGMLIVNYHNIWVKDWTVLVTLIGWVLLAEGVCYIVFPKQIVAFFNKLPRSQAGWGLVTLVMAGVFGYFGFLV